MNGRREERESESGLFWFAIGVCPISPDYLDQVVVEAAVVVVVAGYSIG